MSEKQEHNLIQTYITEPGRMISTMYRESSAIYAPGYYYETIVWEWDRKTKERGAILHTEDSGAFDDTAYKRHAELVRRAVTGQSFEDTED